VVSISCHGVVGRETVIFCWWNSRYICTFIRLHMSEISWFALAAAYRVFNYACVMQGGGCVSVVLLPSPIQWLSRSFLLVLRYRSLYYINLLCPRPNLIPALDSEFEARDGSPPTLSLEKRVLLLCDSHNRDIAISSPFLLSSPSSSRYPALCCALLLPLTPPAIYP
jgi:hypothetical protein